MSVFFSQSMQVLRERSEPYWDVQAHVLEDLREGRFEANGVRVSSESRGDIEMLSAHFFDDQPKIDWDANTLANFGVRFERVRIRSCSSPNAVSLLQPSIMRGVGRPSRASEVDRIIDYACGKGLDLGRMPRKKAMATIRALGLEFSLNIESGFSKPVMQRVLCRRFGPRIKQKNCDI